MGYGNAALDERTVDGNLLPAPWVELVENPAFVGTVGVRESTCTTTDVLTWPSAGGRRPSCTSATGPPCCWRRAGEVKAVHRGSLRADDGAAPKARRAWLSRATPSFPRRASNSAHCTRVGWERGRWSQVWTIDEGPVRPQDTKSRGHQNQSGTILVWPSNCLNEPDHLTSFQGRNGYHADFEVGAGIVCLQ